LRIGVEVECSLQTAIDHDLTCLQVALSARNENGIQVGVLIVPCDSFGRARRKGNPNPPPVDQKWAWVEYAYVDLNVERYRSVFTGPIVVLGISEP
jgi:hypothetical protein